MAPEHAPGLVVFDARLDPSNGVIKGDLYYVEVPPGKRLRVRWDVIERPEGFVSICEGVAFVEDTEGLKNFRKSPDAAPDKLSENQYRWSEGLNEGIPWIMFVIILPEEYSIVQSYPKPARAKQFKNERIAIYWILKGDEIGRTTVDVEIKKNTISISDEVIRLNRELTASISLTKMSNLSVVDPVRVFISYAHKDEKFKDELIEHLSGLKNNKVISDWTDREIRGGEIWDDTIKRNLEQSRIILFLVSSSFMNSGYINKVEIQRSIEKHNRDEAVIVPIIIRHCDFKSLPLEKFQALPKNAKPIVAWKPRDKGWLDVINQLKNIIQHDIKPA